MDDLTYDLKQLCRRNKDGGAMTQAQRMHSLASIARQLKEAGFRNMRTTSLKGTHVDTLLERWQAENLSVGTIKNRMSHLRRWAQKVGVIPADNAGLGIPQRQYAGSVSGDNRAKDLYRGDLGRVRDAHVHMNLRLQQAFGLRREESIKFQPAYADRGGDIALKGSWCKGGRERTVPITATEQRIILDQAHMHAGSGSLIPAHKSYIQQRHVYDGQQGSRPQRHARVASCLCAKPLRGAGNAPPSE